MQYAANVDKIVQDDVDNQQRLKDDIDSCDISTGMVFILVYWELILNQPLLICASLSMNILILKDQN
ncbi:MAG: hypothetical protein IPN87_15765 [Saprospiraceae bacterium]|nr:hypothetical protein [Candidatus Brachybacter algidus]